MTQDSVHSGVVKRNRLRRSRGLARAVALLLAVALLPGCDRDSTVTPETVLPSPSFRGIGDLPGGAVHSEALAISDDGRVVVGRSASAWFDEEGCMIAGDDTLVALLGPGGAPTAGEPRALTADGAIVAGKIVTAGGALAAARWTAATGWVAFDDLAGGVEASQALGISASGTVLVGWGSSNAGYEAARWVKGSPLAIGDLPGGIHNSAAALVSSDGAIVVGTGSSGSGPEVFVWMESTGIIGLGDLAGGKFSSEPFGMTPDASTIVGEATSALGIEAFLWTTAAGMTALGDLPGGASESIAFDVSAAGSVVVGYGNSASGREAFVWDAVHGMRSLRDLLLAAGLANVKTWQLREATGISADGKVVIGNGINPGGQTEGWIARLP